MLASDRPRLAAAPWRPLAPGGVVLATLTATLAGCPSGDVGAPCNHGLVTPPQTALVSFPALMCDDLLCVYGEANIPPATSCSSDEACQTDPGDLRFRCEMDDAGNGECVVDPTYMLERSMCSRRCASDEDCEDRGIGLDPLAERTACRTGFRCTELQALGDLCCEKMCVCEDALADGALEDLVQACQDPDAACSETD